MKNNCGIDMVDVNRIEKAIKDSSSFARKVFTQNEIDYCESKKINKYKSYAARFAAKEAYIKALGTGFIGDLKLNDIETLNEESGKPYLVIRGERTLNTDVSLSHDGNKAIAIVIMEK